MTCQLYGGTLYYHPGCGQGYSYYYQGCCNAKWYIGWNILLWAFVLLSCLTVGIIIARARRL
jgi:hypothetical protein